MRCISDKHLWNIEGFFHQGQYDIEIHKLIGLPVQILPMAKLRIVLLLQLFSREPFQPPFKFAPAKLLQAKTSHFSFGCYLF